MTLKLVRSSEIETAIGGSVVYAAMLDGVRVGWVGDERPWRGWRYGGRRWYATWSEPGQTWARWNGDNATWPTRSAALAALEQAIATGAVL